MKTALDLRKGESATIKHIHDMPSACKMLAMGVLPHTTVTLVRRSPFGGSLYLKINQQCMALRIEEALNIEVE